MRQRRPAPRPSEDPPLNEAEGLSSSWQIPGFGGLAVMFQTSGPARTRARTHLQRSRGLTLSRLWLLPLRAPGRGGAGGTETDDKSM